ncbi:MAG: DUF6527 family protein [Pseudomonadota bacterium]
MPKELASGVLYVSKEFNTAAHLCACGCGAKVRTPLTPTEWTLTLSQPGPTLIPSIGSWQLPCKSHYWITDGEISWSTQWTNEQIIRGRKQEGLRRREYFERAQYTRPSILEKFWHWVEKLFH